MDLNNNKMNVTDATVLRFNSIQILFCVYNKQLRYASIQCFVQYTITKRNDSQVQELVITFVPVKEIYVLKAQLYHTIPLSNVGSNG